jgi:colanic acid biosynthesis glycosyl transferase WcaI
MKILLYGSNYAPELTGIGRYTAEMAQWLAGKGHQVKVIVAPPHYPPWQVQDGFSAWRWSRRMEHGVLVWRCPAFIPSMPRGLSRIIHTVSFAAASFPILLAQLFWRPDVVWVVEPPFACAPGAVMLARLARASAWLHVQDFEIDAAFGLGFLKGERLQTLVTGFERWLMRKFDVVSTISGRMMERLRSKGLPDPRIVALPNWADVAQFNGVAAGSCLALRNRLALQADSRVVLYSGNMGRKQGLEILAKVAASPLFRKAPGNKVIFVFCGEGVGRDELERLCSGLENVRFSDLLPPVEFPALMTLASVHLLPQLPEASDLVMPSKLTAILASRRPVVATAAPESELARVASCAGIIVAPGDHVAMASAVARLIAEDDLRVRLGEAGGEYAMRFMDKDVVLSGLESDFRRLVRRNRGVASV